MELKTTGKIKEKISTGRIVEARTLLTISGMALSSGEHEALNQELQRIETETQDLLNSADRLEQEGKITEAKAIYEDARRLAVDDPAILAHIKRMDESLLLTRAIKKRSQRISEARQTSSKHLLADKKNRLVRGGCLCSCRCRLFLAHVPAGTSAPARWHGQQNSA